MASFFVKNGIDVFRKLKHNCHVFIIPSSSIILFIPKTKSMFSWIYDHDHENDNHTRVLPSYPTYV